jgi:hypothetical protein
VEVGKLEHAMLLVEESNSVGEKHHDPLPLRGDLAPSRRASEVYMVGYPVRPSGIPPDQSGEELHLVDTLRRVFRMRYGFKRLALGLISHPLGQVPHDTVPWAIGHDATTLGGNSGSCVVALTDGAAVLGLHFGGIFFDYNLAHVFAALPALRSAPVAPLGLTWR